MLLSCEHNAHLIEKADHLTIISSIGEKWRGT